MKITGALVSTAALLVLGSMPLSAKAQCGVAYGDYAVNEEEGTIDAWTYMQEYLVPECPWYYGYQYGYYDHHYSVSAQITSPTQNVAYDEDYQIMPYGGGGAVAFTTIFYLGDSGVYEMDWFMGLFCTIGGTLGLSYQDGTVEPPATPCPVEAITPHVPDPYPLNTTNLTSATQTARTCLINAVNQAGGSFTTTSGYRPQSYQDHLREVWDKYQAVSNWPPDQCPAIKANVVAEWAIHNLVFQPATTSNHSSGKAFDGTWTLPSGQDIDSLASGCDLSRPVPGDPVHFELDD